MPGPLCASLVQSNLFQEFFGCWPYLRLFLGRRGFLPLLGVRLRLHLLLLLPEYRLLFFPNSSGRVHALLSNLCFRVRLSFYKVGDALLPVGLLLLLSRLCWEFSAVLTQQELEIEWLALLPVLLHGFLLFGALLLCLAWLFRGAA